MSTPWNVVDHASDNDFTWEDVEEHGVEINKLKDGNWFAFVGSASANGLSGLRMWTGQVVHKCLGSVLVQLDRSWDDRVWWAPETKVVKLPHPNEGKRITLTQFVDD